MTRSTTRGQVPASQAGSMIGRTLGRYRIEARLGQGGMATVWRAEDTLLRRTVALKVLSENLAGTPEGERRFLREARAASALDHPCAAAVYDAGKADGLLFIAFSCVDGETVSDRATRTPFTDEETIALGIAMADALAHAHARGILHRDITGRNVMVGHDGRVFVLDFGLAWVAGSARLTSSNTMLGTCAYLSPEVASGGAADARSDLYGLGAVLYEALAGAPPFRGDNPASILHAVLNSAPEPLGGNRSGLRSDLAGIVNRLLDKRPDLRFQTADDLVAELRGLSPGPAKDPAVRRGDGARTRAALPPARPAPGPRQLPDVIYLAVLDFEDLGSADDPSGVRAAFARGLAGAVSAALARDPEIRLVPARSSHPEIPPGDVEGLARALGANTLLRGSVRRAGIHLRISYELLDPFRRVVVAGDTLDGTAVELFDLEDRLVLSVIRALGLEPAPGAADGRRATRDPAAHERFVQALGYLQRYEDEAHVDAALGLLDRLAETESACAPVHAALGRACLLKYRLNAERSWEARAAAACQRALELDPDSPEVLFTLGELRVSAGQYLDAIEHYRRALALRGDRHEMHIGMALAYEGLGRFEEAAQCLRRAITLRPDYWGAYNELGNLLARQGQFESALEPFRTVVALTPDNYRGYQNLGMAYFNLARYDEALRWTQQSIDLRPTAPGYSNLGTILFYLGRYPDAAGAFRKATMLRPSDPLLWGNLGGACILVEDQRADGVQALEHGIALVRDRLGRNPNHARDWLRLAGWQANLGRHDAAREALGQALELGRNDVTIVAYAGVIVQQSGDREGALRHLREAVRRGYDIDLLRRDPHLGALRDDPEFLALVREAPTAHGRQESS